MSGPPGDAKPWTKAVLRRIGIVGCEGYSSDCDGPGFTWKAVIPWFAKTVKQPLRGRGNSDTHILPRR
jgi:hypothetical protein